MLKKLFFIFVIGGLLYACKDKAWYEKIERIDYEQKKDYSPSLRVDILRLAIQEPEKDLSKIAFKELLNTSEFTTAYEGDGIISQNVLSYHILMESYDRREIFLDLLRRARKAGQIYALIALSEIDYKTYIKKINDFANDTTQIDRTDHDTEYKSTVGNIVISEWSRNNLLGTQTPSDWLLKKPPIGRDFLPELDLNQIDVINNGFKDYFEIVEHYLD